jgi:hypothetical protein
MSMKKWRKIAQEKVVVGPSMLLQPLSGSVLTSNKKAPLFEWGRHRTFENVL